MSTDEQEIEQLKTAGLSLQKQNKQAQDAFDNALAEVDRLKTVAIELEKANKAKEAMYQQQELALIDEIKLLEDDTEIALANLNTVKEQIVGQEVIKTDLDNAIRSQEQEKSDGQTEVDVAVEELDSITLQIETATKNHEKQTESHRASMTSHQQETLRFLEVSNQQKNETEASLQLAKAALALESGMVTAAKANLDSVIERIETYTNELSLIENNRVITLKDLDTAKETLSNTIENIQAQDVLLESLKKEVVIVQAEMKPLITKRIESISFMEELKHKEANLRKRYEDVGLEY